MALVRDMPWSHTFWAGVIGLVTAAAGCASGMRRAGAARPRRRGTADPCVAGSVRLPADLGDCCGAARLAPQRLRPARAASDRHADAVGVVLEAWRDPVALYALIVAFSITQPTVSDTLNRALPVRSVGYALSAVGARVGSGRPRGPISAGTARPPRLAACPRNGGNGVSLGRCGRRMKEG